MHIWASIQTFLNFEHYHLADQWVSDHVSQVEHFSSGWERSSGWSSGLTSERRWRGLSPGARGLSWRWPRHKERDHVPHLQWFNSMKTKLIQGFIKKITKIWYSKCKLTMCSGWFSSDMVSASARMFPKITLRWRKICLRLSHRQMRVLPSVVFIRNLRVILGLKSSVYVDMYRVSQKKVGQDWSFRREIINLVPLFFGTPCRYIGISYKIWNISFFITVSVLEEAVLEV